MVHEAQCVLDEAGSLASVQARGEELCKELRYGQPQESSGKLLLPPIGESTMTIADSAKLASVDNSDVVMQSQVT